MADSGERTSAVFRGALALYAVRSDANVGVDIEYTNRHQKKRFLIVGCAKRLV